MKPGKGKAKGSAFERQVCKDLSLWITKGEKDDCLWRSAMSGGRATISKAKGKGLAHVAGDICATHPAGHRLIDLFFVECKAYADLKLAQLMTSNKGLVVDFLQQARKQADQNGKLLLLVLKQNKLPTMLGLSLCGVNKLSPTVYGCRPLAILPTLDLTLFDYRTFLAQVAYLPIQRRKLA